MKFCANYFYRLVDLYFKKGVDYKQFKDKNIFNLNYKSTLDLLNATSNESNVIDKLSILRSLQTIGVPSEDKLIVKLIENINLNKLDLSKTLKILLNQVQFQTSEQQKQFIGSLVELIESKSDEIAKLDTVLMIYNEKIGHLFSKEFLNKVDSIAVELSGDSKDYPLKEQEITWILHKLSLIKRRPKPFIKYLVNDLIEKDFEKLDLNIVISLVNSLANLNYLSINLMSKIDEFLIQNQFDFKINKFDFILLLKSYIRLRYEPTELLNYICDHIEIINDKLGVKPLMHLVNTMAFFNYQKEKVNQLLSKPIFKEIDIDIVNEHDLLIDYLWSLAFYDNLTKSPLDLFTSDFYTKVLDREHFYFLRPRFVLLYQYCKLNLGLDIQLPEKYFQLNNPIKEKKIKIDDFLFVLKKDHYLADVPTETGFKFGI